MPQGWEAGYNRHAIAIGMFGEAMWRELYKNRITNGIAVDMRMYALQQIEEAIPSLTALRHATTWLSEEEWMNALDIEHLTKEEVDQYGIPSIT